MPGTFRLVRNEFGFLCSLFAATLGLVLLSQHRNHAGVPLRMQFAWTAVVAVVSYVFLESIRYLDSFRPRPSTTELFTLCLSLLLPYMVLKQVYFAFTGRVILHYHEICLGLPAVAMVAWLYRYAAGLRFERSGQKGKLWLLLDGAETVELTTEMRRDGLLPYYDLTGTPDGADLVVFSKAGSGHFESSPDLLLAHLNGMPVRDVRHLLAEIRGRESLDSLDLWFFLLTATPQRRMFRFYFRLKSIFEPLAAAALLVLLLPITAAAALGVKLSGPGPVLYRQKRLGFQGKEFELVKFRSMVADAEAKGPAWAGQQAAMVTPIGAFLRRSHLDEIPQLWNVMKGEMSFVGPRPERPEYYAILKQDIPLFWIRTLVRPGVTGWAQVTGGYASSVEESREKLEYDLYYMKRMSPILDLKILVQTFFIFLRTRDELAK